MKIDRKGLCNITKHEPYFNIDYEELENFSFVHSDEEQKDNTEFSMINLGFLGLDLEVSDGVSNASVPSVILNNLYVHS